MSHWQCSKDKPKFREAEESEGSSKSAASNASTAHSGEDDCKFQMIKIKWQTKMMLRSTQPQAGEILGFRDSTHDFWLTIGDLVMSNGSDCRRQRVRDGQLAPSGLLADDVPAVVRAPKLKPMSYSSSTEMSRLCITSSGSGFSFPGVEKPQPAGEQSPIHRLSSWDLCDWTAPAASLPPAQGNESPIIGNLFSEGPLDQGGMFSLRRGERLSSV